MAQSILNSIKKVLSLDPTNPSFDLDIVMHANSVFFVLKQLGIGPAEGFEIEDDETTWDAFTDVDKGLNAVKTYMYLKLRLIFDPPQTSFAIESMNKQILEYEVRLSIHREELSWTEGVRSL